MRNHRGRADAAPGRRGHAITACVQSRRKPYPKKNRQHGRDSTLLAMAHLFAQFLHLVLTDFFLTFFDNTAHGIRLSS
jgi:hypothetical protein